MEGRRIDRGGGYSGWKVGGLIGGGYSGWKVGGLIGGGL